MNDLLGNYFQFEELSFVLLIVLFFFCFIEIMHRWRKKIQSPGLEKNGPTNKHTSLRKFLQFIFYFCLSYFISLHICYIFLIILTNSLPDLGIFPSPNEVLSIRNHLAIAYYSVIFGMELAIYLVARGFIHKTDEVYRKDRLVKQRCSTMDKFINFLRVSLFTSLGFVGYFVVLFLIFNKSLFNPPFSFITPWFFLFTIVAVIHSLLCAAFYIFYLKCLVYEYISPYLIKDLGIIYFLQNRLRLYHKGLACVKLSKVSLNEIQGINTFILKNFRSLTAEVRIESGRLEIFFWYYIHGFRKRKIKNKLIANAVQFRHIFPGVVVEYVNPDRLERLVNLSLDQLVILKSEKRVQPKFLLSTTSNEIDTLIKSSSTLLKRKVSFIYYFRWEKLFDRIVGARTSQFPSKGSERQPRFFEKDTAEEERKMSLQREVQEHGRMLTSGMFNFDFLIFFEKNGLSKDQVLQTKYELENIAQNVYNIKLVQINFTERQILELVKLCYRLPLETKLFVISGHLLERVFPIPRESSFDIPVLEKFMDLGYPAPVPDCNRMLVLGELVYFGVTRPWEFPLDDLTRGVTIIGTIGMGKTTLVKRLVQQVKEHNVPFLIFDIKRDYIDLFDKQTLVLKPGKNLHLNLFDPVDNDPENYASYVFSLCEELLPKDDSFSPQMLEILSQALKETCTDKSKRSLEAFWETAGKISKNFPKGENSLSGLRVRLAPIFRGALRRVLSAPNERIVNLEQILSFNVIVDLNYFQTEEGASDRQIRFLVNLMLKQVYSINLKRAKHSDGKIQHLTVLDDAHKYYPATKDGDPDNYLLQIIELCRKTGEGMIVSTQSPDNMDEEVLDYPNTQVFLRHVDKHKRSLHALGDYQKNIIAYLPMYHALVRNNQSTHPFEIQTIKPEIEMKYTDEEIDAITESNLNLFWKRPREVPKQLKMELSADNTSPPKSSPRSLAPDEVRISEGKPSSTKIEPKPIFINDIFETFRQDRPLMKEFRKRISSASAQPLPMSALYKILIEFLKDKNDSLGSITISRKRAKDFIKYLARIEKDFMLKMVQKKKQKLLVLSLSQTKTTQDDSLGSTSASMSSDNASSDVTHQKKEIKGRNESIIKSGLNGELCKKFLKDEDLMAQLRSALQKSKRFPIPMPNLGKILANILKNREDSFELILKNPESIEEFARLLTEADYEYVLQEIGEADQGKLGLSFIFKTSSKTKNERRGKNG